MSEKLKEIAALCLLTPALLWAQDGLSVKALRALPGKACLYEIAFTTTDELSADAEIRLSFPAGFDLTAFEIAGSISINGGFTWKREGQQVTLRRSGLGAAVPRGQKVKVQLGLIQNPADFATAAPVRVEVFHTSKAKTPQAITRRVEFESR